MIKQLEQRIVHISDIELGDRKREELGSITELADSIKKLGLLHPPTVKELGNGKYKLLAGGRRILAMLELKISALSVIVYDKDLTNLELRSIELRENIDRKELTWDERISLVNEIHKLQTEIFGKKSGGVRSDLHMKDKPEDVGWSSEDTAELLGMTRGNVGYDLRIADLIQAVPEMKNCKDRNEALNFLKTARKQVEVQAKVEVYEKDQSSTPEAKLKQRLCDSYIIGDALEKIQSVKPNSIDWIELDPPYGIDLKSKLKGNGLTKLDYNEVDNIDYPQFISEILSECYRVLAPDGWLICWFGIDWYGVTLCTLEEELNFKVPSVPCIWTKGMYAAQTMQPSKRLANSYETFFYAHKGHAELRKKGRINQFHFQSVTTTSKIHPTEKPVELVQEILHTFAETSTVGLVPFLGSGNTLLAASNLGMVAHGYDLSENFRDGYIVRVNEGEYRKYRSYKDAPK